VQHHRHRRRHHHQVTSAFTATELSHPNLRDAFPSVVALLGLLWLFVYFCINEILSESAGG